MRTLTRVSSFIPGRPPSTSSSVSPSHITPPSPAIPKPPSPFYYSPEPYLPLSKKLAHLIHRTRQVLHAERVLPRYAAKPNFAETGIRLRHLRWSDRQVVNQSPELAAKGWEWGQVKWVDRQALGLLVGSSKPLRVSAHRQLLDQLSECRSLYAYLRFALDLSTPTTPPSSPSAAVTSQRQIELKDLASQISHQVDTFLRPTSTTTSTSIQDRRGSNYSVGRRDELCRFYGIGKKKEASARVWMIEVFEYERNLSTKLEQEQKLPEIGQVLVNGAPLSQYFKTSNHLQIVLNPLEISSMLGLYNIHLVVSGSGLTSQAHACASAIASALLKALAPVSDPPPKSPTSATSADTAPPPILLSLQQRYGRKVLIKSQLAKRDPRVVERKKTGRKGARARFTWVKR